MRQLNWSPIQISSLVLVAIILVLTGCSTVPPRSDNEIPAKLTLEQLAPSDTKHQIDAYDPWEGFNRRVYKFNAKFDQYVFLPIVNGYTFITPAFVRTGVSNFYDNLEEIKNFVNSLLQLKGKKAAVTVGRFAVNSTFGVLGFIEAADSLGLKRQDEDFGQTLGHYGVGPGRYLVLPIFGPSTARDASGLVVDAVVYNLWISALVDEMNMDSSDEDRFKLVLAILDAIDERYKAAFRYYGTGSPFEYELVRMLYLDARRFKVNN